MGRKTKKPAAAPATNVGATAAEKSVDVSAPKAAVSEAAAVEAVADKVEASVNVPPSTSNDETDVSVSEATSGESTKLATPVADASSEGVSKAAVSEEQSAESATSNAVSTSGELSSPAEAKDGKAKDDDVIASAENGHVDATGGSKSEAENPKGEVAKVAEGAGGKDGAAEELEYGEDLPLYPMPVKGPSGEEVELQVNPADTVMDIRQFLAEAPETCFYTSYDLILTTKDGTRYHMIDFIEIGEVTDIPAGGCSLEMFPTFYDDRSVRLHVRKFRDLVSTHGSFCSLSTALAINHENAHNLINERFDEKNGKGDKTAKNGAKEDQKVLPAELEQLGFAEDTAKGMLQGLCAVNESVDAGECLESIAYSYFNPVQGYRKLQGDIMYFEITTLEGESFCVTAHTRGFSVNCSDPHSRRSVLDPRLKEPKQEASTLVGLLRLLSPSFEKAFATVLEKKASRNPFENIVRHVPTNHWLGVHPIPEHTRNVARAEDALSMPFGQEVTGVQRDWNEELQSCRELPKTTAQDRLLRDRALYRITSEFVEAAAKGAKCVVGRGIPPINPTDPERFHMYVHNSIFFSLALDGDFVMLQQIREKDLLEQAEAAKKKAALEASGKEGEAKGEEKEAGVKVEEAKVEEKAKVEKEVEEKAKKETKEAEKEKKGSSGKEEKKKGGKKGSAKKGGERTESPSKIEETAKVSAAATPDKAETVKEIEGADKALPAGEAPSANADVGSAGDGEKDEKKEGENASGAAVAAPLVMGETEQATYASTNNDLKGTKLLNSLDISGLHTLGMAIVDYRGHRVIAQSIIPGILYGDKNQALKYGSVDSGKNIKWNEEFHKKVLEVGNDLHLKEHEVKDGEEAVVKLAIPVESKGILGSDDRRYLLDLVRLTPRDANYKGQGSRLCAIRPELLEEYCKEEEVKQWMKSHEGEERPSDEKLHELRAKGELPVGPPLKFNPNVFTDFKVVGDPKEIEADEAAVTAIGQYVLDTAIPGFITKCRSLDASPMDGQTLTDALHSCGINLRYLGKVSKAVEGKLGHIYELCVTEMVVRSCKHVLKAVLRETLDQDVGGAIAHFINCFLGISGTTLFEASASIPKTEKPCRPPPTAGTAAAVAAQKEDEEKAAADARAAAEPSVSAAVSTPEGNSTPSSDEKTPLVPPESGKEAATKPQTDASPASTSSASPAESTHPVKGKGKKGKGGNKQGGGGGGGGANGVKEPSADAPSPAATQAPTPAATPIASSAPATEAEEPESKSAEAAAATPAAVGGGGAESGSANGEAAKTDEGKEEPKEGAPTPPVMDDRPGYTRIVAEMVWSDICEGVKFKYQYTLPDNIRTIVRHMSTLRNFCLKMGVVIAARDYDLETEAPLALDDIQDMIPVVKCTTPVSQDVQKLLDRGKHLMTEVGLPHQSKLLEAPLLTQNWLQQNQVKLNEAFDIFTEAYNQQQQVYGPLHLDVALCCRSLGKVLFHAGETGSAILHQHRELIINERCLGLGHPDTARSYANLALFYHAHDEGELALRHLAHALAMFAVTCGPNHPETAALFITVAMAYRERGRLPLALRYLQSSLQCNQKLLGESHVQTAASFHALALASSHMGAFKLAIQHEKKALAIYEAEIGKTNLKTVESARWLQSFQRNESQAQAKKSTRPQNVAAMAEALRHNPEFLRALQQAGAAQGATSPLSPQAIAEALIRFQQSGRLPPGYLEAQAQQQALPQSNAYPHSAGSSSQGNHARPGAGQAQSNIPPSMRRGGLDERGARAAEGMRRKAVARGVALRAGGAPGSAAGGANSVPTPREMEELMKLLNQSTNATGTGGSGGVDGGAASGRAEGSAGAGSASASSSKGSGGSSGRGSGKSAGASASANSTGGHRTSGSGHASGSSSGPPVASVAGLGAGLGVGLGALSGSAPPTKGAGGRKSGATPGTATSSLSAGSAARGGGAAVPNGVEKGEEKKVLGLGGMDLDMPSPAKKVKPRGKKVAPDVGAPAP
eukprot:TRINITY_DN10955_c0_g1_i1.p1 TRINITY_DN10955_c0_g1~~TRINITY_DN10955_c0_g1_i1.p1  ORF type:complete len:1987 (+),score=538.25 TRINITY_DN10955_c0_g1_i1:283-6243(+)